MYQVKEEKKTMYVCGPKEKKDNIRVTLATLIIKEVNSKSRENREASFPAFVLQQNKLKLNLNFTPPQRIMSMKSCCVWLQRMEANALRNKDIEC